MTVGSNVRRRIFWTAAFILVVFVTVPQAQQRQAVSYASDGTPSAPSTTRALDLLVGRSAVLNVRGPIARISLTVPDIADALVTAPQEILIHGKMPGTISLFVWEKTGAISTYEVTVRRDLGLLAGQLVQLFPGEQIQVTGSNKDVVLAGAVSSQYVVDKAAEVAVAYAEKKENVVNLLKLQEGIASNQVLLRVRFAEVSRTAVQELGASLFTGPGGFHDYVARSTTQQFAAPDFETTRESIQGVDHWGGDRDTVTATGGKQTFSDFLNLFLFNNRLNLGALVRAMQSKGVFQSLAEPNLVATDGKEASFLAGGEYPYPVVQGSNQGTSVSIQFKEFGVRLKFTPTILGGDLINLKIQPEVSALDFSNAVTIQGFRVPALSTRRTQTEIELHDGQTFAVAGLLNNTAVSSMRKIPGIGDIPILGLLFKSKAYDKQTTELVVMITPQILRRNSTGVSQGLPNLIEPFLPPPAKSFRPAPPYIGSPRTPGSPDGQGSTEATSQPPPAATSAPSAAAAVVTATPEPSGVPRQLTKEQTRQIEAARKAEAEQWKAEERQRKAEAARQVEAQTAATRAATRAAMEEQKRQQAEAKAALKKAQEDKKKADAAAREQAKRDEATAKKAGEEKRRAEEQRKRQAAEDAKREKALTDAAAKLKDAQKAYEALVRPPGVN